MVAVALVITVASTGFVVFAFRKAPEPPVVDVPTTVFPTANGEIYVGVVGEGSNEWDSVAPDGSAWKVVIPRDSPLQYLEIAWAPDGSRFAFTSFLNGHGVYTAAANGTDIRQLTDGVNDSWPSWSPDGSKIVFSSTRSDSSQPFCGVGGDGGCPTDLYVMDTDGNGVTRLTNDPAPEFAASWSPDGTRIAFVSTSDPPDLLTGIFSMSADGSDPIKLASTSAGSNFAPTWSPDGSRLAFLSIRGEEWWVFVVSADGTGERSIVGKPLAADRGSLAFVKDVAWSPDGQWIAFTGALSPYDPARGSALYLVRPENSGLHEIAAESNTDLGEIAWRPVAVASATARVTGTFDVGLRGQASGLTYGFGSIWVDGFESPSGLGQVIRLDSGTGEQQADISIGSVAPGWEVGGGGITVGDGSVWIVGTEQVPGSSPGVFDGLDTILVRIDPSTNRVVDRIVLGGKVAADVAIDANGVWVLFGGDDDTMEIARVDPATDQVVATIPLQQAYGHYLFSVDGAILAFTNETTTDRIGNSVVNVIDPLTETVTASVSLGEYVWPAAGDGSVWAATGTTLQRIDPSSGAVTDTWPLISTGDPLSVGAGGVWSVSPMGRSTVMRWNPALQAVDLSVPLPDDVGANVIATSRDAVWVLSFDGAITRIQPSN